jgi:hypothetical protein
MGAGLLIVAGHVPRPVRRIDRKVAGRIPMRTSNLFALALLVLLAGASFARSTRAADLSGAWASPDASVCSKVFVKDNDRMSFTPDAELYGGGLIVEGNRATGTFQKCTIKSMKDDGANIRLIAACSTGVMVSDVEFTVKIVGDNQIMVSMPAPDNMQTPYVRCPR